MSRWTMESQEDALLRCSRRNAEGITCTLHLLEEYTEDPGEARAIVRRYSELIEVIARDTIRGGISLKLTSIGALVDKEMARRQAVDLALQAESRGVGFEIDMEGKGLVEFTIQTAVAIRDQNVPVVVALQAYLDRSRMDLQRLLEGGVTPRLVKGAYSGDASGFEAIEIRFKELAGMLIDRQSLFHVGTHDPVLLSWLQDRLQERRNLVRFGFLLGLSDVTKQSMARNGWAVSEYIPIGEGGQAYIRRRERYLSELRRLKRDPAP